MNQQLKPYHSDHYRCDDCQKEFFQTTTYASDSSLKLTYCANCVEKNEEETCSFWEKDEQTNQYITCDKPLFDKKKQLCRSHNRQVRKKFNEFTKDMSVSSTAAWEMQWEQSGNWKYFWNLGEEAIQKNLTNKSPNDKKKSKPKNWGFAPLYETTENLQSLSLDKRTLKKTGRIHLFATRVKKEWIEQLKSIAYEERLKYVEVLEKALRCYEKHRKT